MKTKIFKAALVVLTCAIVGCSSAPDCADQDARNLITDNYGEEMVKSQIPDLVMAINQKRIKFSTDMVTETSRNKESKSVQCSAKLVINFPQEDLDLINGLPEGQLTAMMHRFKIPTEPVYSTMINYTVAYSADKGKSGGPIVNMRMRDPSKGKELGTYIAAYSILSLSVKDITDDSRNNKQWNKDYKDTLLAECSKRKSSDLCRCRIDHMESILSQEDAQRVDYAFRNNVFAGNKYPNLIKLDKALDQQCPLPAPVIQETASVPATQSSAASQQTTPQPTPTEQPAPIPAKPAAPAVSPVMPSLGDSASRSSYPTPAKPAIEASFDCKMASSRIEKMICSSPEAAASDKQLANAYSTASRYTMNQQQLRNDQNRWMREVRNQCNDSACLVRVSKDRVDYLRSMQR